MFYTCLLLTCVSLVVSQHVSLNREIRGSECRNSDLRRIEKYFKDTTIVRNEDTTEIHYCVKKKELKDSFDLQYLDHVIDLYKSFDYVNSFKYVDPDGPMIQDGFLSVNQHQELPLFQIADIRRKTLPCSNTYPGFGNDVNDQMILMGLNTTDEPGFLLAHSLGGLSKANNVIPMAINLYEILPQLIMPEQKGLGVPLSNWRSNEFWIRKFLLHYYANGRVLWKSAVQYEKKIFSFPMHYQTYRPLSISLQYVAYTNENDRTSEYYRSPQITFLNNNDYPCDTGTSCHDKEVDAKHPKYCDIEVLSTTKTPIGKLGDVHNSGKFDRNYIVTIPFYMTKEKTFIYQQAELKDTVYIWAISEIRPDGTIIEKHQSTYKENRNVAFTYFMNGTQYLYTYDSAATKWYINELLPGNMSEQVTDQGSWTDKVHTKAVPFTINGVYYFFSQLNGKDKAFIKTLEPYGQLKKGEEANVETKDWKESSVVFSYIINNKHYLYAHKPHDKSYTINEILEDGKLGDEIDKGTVEIPCDDSFTYTIHEKRFIYGFQINPFHMFIRELLPNGKMAEKVTYSSTDDADAHDSAVPIILDGKQYVLGQKKEEWKILELL